MAETYRLFFAVKVPAADRLRSVIGKLAQMGRAVKPVSPENLHVTLKFLGETDAELLPLLEESLQKSVEAVSAFESQLTGLGAFPNARRPSVVWIGMQHAEALIEIADRLERELVFLGFPPEKRHFQPHLTVARVRSKPPRELFELLESERQASFGSVAVKSIELYRSELAPDGARYTVLVSAALAPR